MQIQYLRQTILQLEEKQVAETITQISNVRKDRLNTQFEIVFEEAINPKPHWVDQKTLISLNSQLLPLYEHDLFKFYNIPQKTTLSHICNNFAGYQHVSRHRTHKNELRE